MAALMATVPRGRRSTPMAILRDTDALDIGVGSAVGTAQQRGHNPSASLGLRGQSQAFSPRAIPEGAAGSYLADLRGDEPLVRELQRVVMAEITLSENVNGWVERFSQVNRRDPYLWIWCRAAAEMASLPSIDAELYDHVIDSVILMVIINAVIDDVADHHGRQGFLDALLDIVEGRGGATAIDPALTRKAVSPLEATTLETLWFFYSTLMQRARSYPRCAEFADIFAYDCRVWANMYRLSHLFNDHPDMMSMVEHDLVMPYNMGMVMYTDLQLMCSSRFEMTDLGAVRAAAILAQYMGRIGNLTTTWRREIDEHDYTSGVFAYAVDKGFVDIEWLKHPDATGCRQRLSRGLSGATAKSSSSGNGSRTAMRSSGSAKQSRVSMFATGLMACPD
ncbi:hypothetical protein [Mycobacterium spongiae]|uniref:Terpene synthase n=1 Tax=Mycobacterium spongiae TaxID=886343 RepID=A0A975JVR2_9MYCO|nr:hypothetical protein [Mycobacterium spongiae]QUR66273.1 hypothetical protein F6B93_03490 [Mycobacterium spongiae]